MPIGSTTRLSEHFTAYELGADKPEATLEIVTRLTTVAAFLERVRNVLNVPLQVNTPQHRNRGFRTSGENVIVGGAEVSSHLFGDAADVVPLGFKGTMFDAYSALKAASQQGRLPKFDQIILYPVHGHIHVGIGARMRGEFRIRLYEGTGGTPLLTDELVNSVRRFTQSPLAVVVVLAVIVLLWYTSKGT